MMRAMNGERGLKEDGRITVLCLSLGALVWLVPDYARSTPSVHSQFNEIGFMNTSSLAQKVWNFCLTLRAAFSGQLVPQDTTDEPVPILLARIRAERAARAPSVKARKSNPSLTRSPRC